MSRTGLAQDFFLIAHDPFTGRSAISTDLLVSGVAAAALADLVLALRLGVTDGRLAVIDRPREGDDAIEAFVLDSIGRTSPRRTVQEWVESLGENVCERVATHLVARGVVRREAHSGLLRRAHDRFPAVDLIKANAPRVRLEHMLRHPGTFDLSGAVSAAIVGALEIERIFGTDLKWDLFEELTEHLPPELQMVTAGAADVGAAMT